MFIHSLSSSSFIMCLNKSDPVFDRVDFSSLYSASNSDDLTYIAKYFIDEISHKYNLDISDKKSTMKIFRYHDNYIALLSYTNKIQGSKRYIIKLPCDKIFEMQKNTIIKFDNIDCLLDCLHALHQTFLRNSISFDLISSSIYLYKDTYLLSITKEPNTLPCLSAICHEFGQSLCYSSNLLDHCAKLNIKNPIKSYGVY